MASPPSESDLWNEARELFLDLADLPEAEREARLAELDARDASLGDRVRELLAHDLGTRESPAPEGPLSEPADGVGLQFGAYRAVRQIAVGGMGEVLLGERSDGEFERQVAIKRLRGEYFGRELVDRFLRERQTLARLDHPYIAHLLDGGTAAHGGPYLILEYVQGSHIDAFCDERSLDVRARVELFREVLEAVTHAHGHGVIHRDLKPSNILIREDGTPRLLDFGIARIEVDGPADQALTNTGQRLFTPEYASPEQVRAERATEASDLFSLGVILYRLLTGVSPWPRHASLHELEACILGADPVPPSRHLEGRARRTVQGDLDTIVLHCLEKEPERRFRSVRDLSEELDRFLQGVPIRTRPTRLLERVVRQGRRNPWQALAAGIMVVALGSGLLALRRGEAAAERGEELLDSLETRLDRARELVSHDRRIEARDEYLSILTSLDSVDQPGDMRLRTMAHLSDVLLRTGEAERAQEVVDEGLTLLPDDPAEAPQARARLLLSAVECRRLLSTPERASAAAQRAYEYAVAWLEVGSALRLEALQALGTDREIPLEDRIGIMTDAVAEGRERNVEKDGVLSGLLSVLGTLHLENGDFEAALPDLEEALEIDRWNHGEGHPDVALGRYLRGVCLYRTGSVEVGRAEIQEALAIFEDRGHEGLAREARGFLESLPPASDG